MELWFSVFLNFILYDLVWNTLPRMAGKYRTDTSNLSATVSQMRLNSCLSALQNGIRRSSFKSPTKDSNSRECLKLPEVWHFARLWLGFEKRSCMFVSQKVFSQYSVLYSNTHKEGRHRKETWLELRIPWWLGLQCYFHSVWLVYCNCTGAADDKLTYICCYLQVFVWVQGVIFLHIGMCRACVNFAFHKINIKQCTWEMT